MNKKSRSPIISSIVYRRPSAIKLFVLLPFFAWLLTLIPSLTYKENTCPTYYVHIIHPFGLYVLFYNNLKRNKGNRSLPYQCLYYAKKFYSFTAPIFTPFTKYFCKNGYKTMKGRIAAMQVLLLKEEARW